MKVSADANERFTTWVVEYRGIIIKIAKSFTERPECMADLQQEMLLQLWRSTQSFEGQCKPSTWIYRVCLNTALVWRRSDARRENQLVPGIDPDHLTTDAESPAQVVAEREIMAKLYRGIRSMRASDRAIVLLQLDGVPYREIAEITGLSESNVGAKLTRARQRLATYMKGATNDEVG